MNLRLARAAYAAARENFHGDTEAAIANLQPIEVLFSVDPDTTHERLLSDWSGAFVYFCTVAAGMRLPLRYADSRVGASFAFVRAWEQYARLPKIGLWRHAAQDCEVGDLVIFETPQNRPPLMGIVTALEEDSMEVAVGNYRNHSALIERPCRSGVRGWIRLEQE